MALQAFWDQVMPVHGGWVLKLDVEAFYDSIDKGLLQEILRKRVRDGVLLRLIGKWMNAGIMEEGVVYHPETGTPQGVVSSILANALCLRRSSKGTTAITVSPEMVRHLPCFETGQNATGSSGCVAALTRHLETGDGCSGYWRCSLCHRHASYTQSFHA
jgi:hypothetical protein